MGGINKTSQNLQESIAGEGFEFQKMYPPYLAEAQKEGEKMAEVSFRNALAVEEIHYGLYSQAASAVTGGADLAPRHIYVCEICGNTVYDHAPDKCQVCGVPGSHFTLID